MMVGSPLQPLYLYLEQVSSYGDTDEKKGEVPDMESMMSLYKTICVPMAMRELEETIKFTRVEAELQHSISYIDCFKGTDSRRTYLTILCMFGQQCMGVAFMAG